MANKLLQRERAIQIGGALLLLSPIFNLILSIALDSPHARPWSWNGITFFLKNVKTISWVLHALSIFVGALMLKGRRSSWILVLVVLGAYIVMNGLTFRQQARSGYFQPVMALAINLTLFFLVYLQEFHQRLYGMPGAPKPKTPAPAPLKPVTPIKANPSIRVDFVGMGPWARVTNITDREIRMTSLTPAFPAGIESMTVELVIAGGKTVRARFVKRVGDEYTFRYLHTAPAELTGRWAA